jgi:hypothetical protein
MGQHRLRQLPADGVHRFIDVIGSWKIMEMRRLRKPFSSDGLRPKLSPRNLIDPRTLALGGSSPMMASDMTDFPDPDSPTMPSTSPGASV